MRVRKLTPQIEAMVKDLIEQAKEIARPKVIYRISSVQHIDDKSVSIDAVCFTSHVLSKCLANLNRVFPCICTCGREIDEWTAPASDLMAG